MTNLAVLALTDGTERVDLVNPRGGGFGHLAWRPAIPGYKDGGTYQSSPLADGRRLIDKRFENAVETFSISGFAGSPDSLIIKLQDLRRLLEKASDYFTTAWQNQPVWLEARAYGETNLRYAVVVQGRAPQDPDPYEPPFSAVTPEAATGALPVVIERMDWTDRQPGTWGAVLASAVETFNSVSFGAVNASGVRTPVSTDVYVANYRTPANLTHIFVNDVSAPSFSANRIAQPFSSFTLFPASPATGDICYFGVSTAVTGATPFGNLIFDLSVAASGLTLVWEYWNGAWVTLTQLAALYTFQNTGFGMALWTRPSNWATTTVNGVTGWWVRARLTGFSGSNPAQQNRNVYSATWPYIEVQASEVGGDLPAWAQYIGSGQKSIATARVMTGLRSLTGRDASGQFTAYLNASDTAAHNPSGISVTAIGTTTFVNQPAVPVGRHASWAPGGASSWASGVNFTISNTVLAAYRGTYRAFARVQQVGGSVGNFRARLRVIVNTQEAYVGPVYRLVTTDQDLADLGLFTIPPWFIEPSLTADLTVRLELAADAAGTIWVYDLVLMPADEYFVDTQLPAQTLITLFSLRVDRSPRRNISADVFTTSSGVVVAPGRPISQSGPVLQSNTHARLWTLSTPNASLFQSLDVVLGWQLKKQQRYLGARGAR